ncbi:MAG: pilus assembly protein N-terminal domain-containing protein [Phenylobacterium sp.]|uniref:pilus assembly protein N-terminal domain-containing protein n=1 Tax=Phenylobacterium sp. TaxID=1871053 RepID=UPI00391CBF9B
MRRLLITALAAAAALGGAAQSAAAAPPLVVRIDQGTRVLFAGPIRDVVVANPNIADVNVLDSRSIVVLGKAAGSTSLLVIDQAGRVLADRPVIVSSSDEGRMSYYRGATAVRDFACSPRCGPIDPNAESAAP